MQMLRLPAGNRSYDSVILMRNTSALKGPDHAVRTDGLSDVENTRNIVNPFKTSRTHLIGDENHSEIGEGAFLQH